MIRKIVRAIYSKVNHIKTYFPLRNVNKTQHEKNCLLSYTKVPFLGVQNDNLHQNRWQVREIARIFGEEGYNVDVIEYNADRVFLSKKYDFVFDILARKTPVYAGKLSENARRIIYFTGSESEFANQAEINRIHAVERRRGVKLQPRRQAAAIEKNVEDYDCAVMIGNEYNLSTYAKFDLKKPHLVPNTGYSFNYPFDQVQKKANNFVYFGSTGCVHKGLDLLLEIFAQDGFPANLYVCGAFEQELDFKHAYEKELYNTSNIIPVGFVDVNSELFRGITSVCAYALMPSCSEGQAGAVNTLMSAGVIPICSKECGFESNEVINLPDCEMETIRSHILSYANKPMDWIKEKSEAVVAVSDTKYCRSEFTRLMTKAIRDALEDDKVLSCENG